MKTTQEEKMKTGVSQNPIRKLCFALCMTSLLAMTTSCTSSSSSGDASADESDLVLAEEGAASTGDDLTLNEASSADSNTTADSSDLLLDDEATQQKVAETQTTNPAPSDSMAEDEFAQFDQPVDQAATQGGQTPTPEETLETLSSDYPEPVPTESLSQPEKPFVAEEPPPAPEQFAQSEPQPSQDPNVNQSFKSRNQNIQITDLQYKGNDAGGTFVIDGNGPMEYTVNKNERLNQYIIDIPYAKLPKKLQRTFNTKDFQGSIGQIDAFESTENSARIVVQLRTGAMDPVVQREGSSLLVIASNYAGQRNDYSDKNAFGLRTGVEPGPALPGQSQLVENDSQVVANESQILEGTSNLRDFLTNNTQFFGKKITLETSTMEVKDALRFIMEDIGVNMVISDKVAGPLSLKLRQVPWDQALSIILKVKGLGFVRQGNVLRIMTMDELKAEEDAAVASDKTQKTLEPLQVKMFRVSYAQAGSIAERLKPFATVGRGKVEADVPTNAVVATDLPEVLDRMEKILKTLDTQPPQVLIEGKIVEASEDFSKSVGVTWGFSGQPVNVSSGKNGPVTLNPVMNVLPGAPPPGTFNFGVSVGVLDIFGNLDASLALNETESQVKVLASPRIVTVTNREARISLDDQESYLDTTPTQGGSVPFNVAKFVSAPTNLTVTPQVTADSSVVMKVSLNRTTLTGSVPPAPQSRSAETNVIVKNGQTMVLGGIFQTSNRENENRVPALGKIPVIGWLFKQKSTNIKKTELLLFLTPKILNQADTEKSITL